jgi:hypothetical protein
MSGRSADNPFAIAGAPNEAAFELHFVRYRHECGGVTLAWCGCGWCLRGETEAVLDAAAVHDLAPDGGGDG